MRRTRRPVPGWLLLLLMVAGIALFGVVTAVLREAGQDWEEVEQRLARPPGNVGYRLENEDGTDLAYIPTGDQYVYVALEDIDPRFVADVVAVEDSTFFAHSGVRWNAVAGAAGRYFAREALRTVDALFGTHHAPQGNVRGGSTITQQLVKNLLKNPPRTVRTKVREILVARRLEATLARASGVPQAKRRILERYLNEIYAAPGLRGMRAAARVLLEKEGLRELDGPARIALLACIQAPAALRAGHARSHNLLARTYAKLFAAERSVGPESPPEALALSAEKYRARLAALVDHAAPTPGVSSYAEALLRSTEPGRLRAPARIRTCRLAGLDRELNRRFHETIGRSKVRPCATVGAFLLVRLADGAILSLGESGCGSGAEAFEARRQILSAFKPFLYARAMEELGLTPASVFVDRRVTVSDRLGRPYAPGNHYAVFKGPISLKTALQFSTNTISLQLLQRLSVHSVINLGQALFRVHPKDRLRDRFHPDYALALGAVELSPAELAVGYLSLLTGGHKRYLRFRCDEPSPVPGRQLIGATTAAQVRDMLRSVVRWEGTAGFTPASGTGLVIKELGGKSGSSERDSWFAGFSEDLLLVVWLGAASGNERLNPQLHAASLWRSMFALTARDFAPRRLTHPENLERAYFCRRTGRKPGTHCRIEASLFAAGQAPTDMCPFAESH